MASPSRVRTVIHNGSGGVVNVNEGPHSSPRPTRQAPSDVGGQPDDGPKDAYHNSNHSGDCAVEEHDMEDVPPHHHRHGHVGSFPGFLRPNEYMSTTECSNDEPDHHHPDPPVPPPTRAMTDAEKKVRRKKEVDDRRWQHTRVPQPPPPPPCPASPQPQLRRPEPKQRYVNHHKRGDIPRRPLNGGGAGTREDLVGGVGGWDEGDRDDGYGGGFGEGSGERLYFLPEDWRRIDEAVNQQSNRIIEEVIRACLNAGISGRHGPDAGRTGLWATSHLFRHPNAGESGYSHQHVHGWGPPEEHERRGRPGFASGPEGLNPMRRAGNQWASPDHGEHDQQSDPQSRRLTRTPFLHHMRPGPTAGLDGRAAGQTPQRERMAQNAPPIYPTYGDTEDW
jgi:hypothetical protein